jgi:hypothetical protein
VKESVANCPRAENEAEDGIEHSETADHQYSYSQRLQSLANRHGSYLQIFHMLPGSHVDHSQDQDCK